MSQKTQNAKYILMGLAAVAAAGVCYYLSAQQISSAKAKALDSDDGLADDDTIPAKGSSTTTTKSKATKGTTDLKTSTKKRDVDTTDRMDEKELHTKIEELDKKGKAFFKDKQVGCVGVRWSLGVRIDVPKTKTKKTSVFVGSLTRFFCYCCFFYSITVSRSCPGIYGSTDTN